VKILRCVCMLSYVHITMRCDVTVAPPCEPIELCVDIRYQIFHSIVLLLRNLYKSPSLYRFVKVKWEVVCLKNVPPPLTCYNVYIHSSIATIFGKNVAEKVGNQNILNISSSPNQCFCTTWGNRKPGNCVFSLK